MYPRAIALAFVFTVAPISLALTQDAPTRSGQSNQSSGTPLPEVVVTAPRQQTVQRRHAPARPAPTRTARTTPVTPASKLTAGPAGVRNAPGQTITSINRNQFDDTRAFSIGSVL